MMSWKPEVQTVGRLDFKPVSPCAELAAKLLAAAHLPVSDVDVLAADLETVHYEPGIDSRYNQHLTREELFLRRLGGLGALSRYLPLIRTK
jgi:hypothetical protein